MKGRRESSQSAVESTPGVGVRYLGGALGMLEDVEVHKPETGHLEIQSVNLVVLRNITRHTVGNHIKARSKTAMSDFHSSQPTTPSRPSFHVSASSSSSSSASPISASFFRPPERFGFTPFPRTYKDRVERYDFQSLKLVGKWESADSYMYVSFWSESRAVSVASGPSSIEVAVSGAGFSFSFN